MKRLLAAALLVLTMCAKEKPSLDGLWQGAYAALRQGDLEGALSAAEKGRKAALDAGDSSWEWAFRVAHAEVLVSQRKNAEVMGLLDDGLARNTTADAIRVRALMTRGVALCRLSAAADVLHRATDDLDGAARIATSLASTELVGEVALRRGTCLLHRKEYSSAEPAFREALAAARRGRLVSLEANASGSLGLLRIETARYDEATEWLQRSLTLATAINADIPRAKTLQNLGWCYYNLGDFDRALRFLSDAEALAGKRHLTGDRLRALTNLGNSYYRKGDLARASEHYDRALVVARELDDRARVATLLSNLGVVAFEQMRYDDAESLLGKALDAQKALKAEGGLLKTVLNQGHVWAARGDAARADAAYRQVLGAAAEPEAQWEAWSGLAVLQVKAGRAAEADKDFGEAFAVMERSGSHLGVAEHRLAFFSSLRRFHDEHVDFLVGAGRIEEALLVADRGRARLLSENLLPREGEGTLQVARYRELARALDSVLLFYWTAPRRSFLWAVTPEEIVVRVLPGSADIGQRAEAYQAQIQRSRDPLAEDASDATWLYRSLIGPIEKQIQPGKRVVVVPDGPLQQLNFETLVVPGARPHYWIEDVTLATAPSLGLLSAGAAAEKTRARSILVIGDPVSPGQEFPPLAYAGREVARIADLFPEQATVQSGASAQPSAYAAAGPGRFAFIHFAAHATANQESPLDSAIVLSGREDSYKLYARDIVKVPLTAELVTLSACRSAGSRAYAGEGLVGLAWAFLGSGARNVIGGLWNVEDASTAELMEHLYRGLQEGLDPIAALRAAKLRLVHSATASRKPYYWAPFVIYTRGG
ncbi:MAG TPA: CHAT domain-containing tetratricopeptide repeat protein [Kofleriaceae bacterium]|nr:CHAT domain-containing tetratricopeptide repeat protein [Kofleriaceae bacterium]